jgi:hypothetical protein
MAELTKLDVKLAEVIGLAMAAQEATTKVATLVKDRELTAQLRTMSKEAATAEKDATGVAAGFKGKKGAVLTEARTVKKKAAKMMSDYLDRNAEGLDGFEFLTMAESGEVGHWAVLGEMAKSAGNREVRSLVSKHLPIQKRHLRDATAGALKLARAEDPTETEGSSGGGGTRRTGASRRRSSSTQSRSTSSSRSAARGRSSRTSTTRRRSTS